MHHDTRQGMLWRAFVWVSWCLLGMACSDHALPVEQGAEEAPRAASLPTQTSSQAAPASADWTAEVQKRMAHGERAIRTDGTNEFRVSHRKQGLSGRFDAAGALRVEARSGAPAVHVQLASVGREDAAHSATVTNVALGACASDGVVDEMGACLKRLEVQRDGVVEWWESRENGLEQGFVIDQRPEGRGLLTLHIAVDGAQVEVDGDHATGATLRVDEQTAWSYAGLAAVDARGKTLESWMERDDAGGIRIVVEDENATYPVVVDPVLSVTAAWTAESDQADAEFGYSVASAGDVNGDGFGDVIVGAPYYDNGELDEGRAFVYLGSASGLATTAAWTAESDQIGARFGTAVASAGDVNGDGYGDVIVGAYGYDNGQSDEGRTFVYLGSAFGLSSFAVWTAESEQGFAQFGSSVSSAGDVNGDGYGDVIVGAYQYDNGQFDEGRVYVYLGSAAGLSPFAAWTAESDQVFAQFGSSVSSAGDVNGDGYGDVIVGAPFYDNGQFDEGRAFVYLGGAAGLSPFAAWKAESDQAGAYFGRSVSSAGDVNGDGYGDVIVGAPYYDNAQSNEGRAFVYLGSAAGLSLPVAAWAAESGQADAAFGHSVASAGDVNGDGFGDVIIGAYGYDNGQTNEGRVFMYLGSANGLLDPATNPPWMAESDQADAVFGISVASAGDVNGDGYGDVIVGANYYDNGQSDEGSAFVYLGNAADVATMAAWAVEADQVNARFGHSVASAGDVNGDGYGDVIVGAPDYGRVFVYLGSASGLSLFAAWAAESDQPAAYFGTSVASAGDVNGDGFGDVIVGAFWYDNGSAHEGRAFVYLGSTNGLLDPTTNPPWTAESDQADAYFGTSVASAGDVNGDGYGDVIVGAPYYDNGELDEGCAYVYLGSASGLAAMAAWTAESDQADAYFGTSVASAGDVNGDGFGDVIVGAPGENRAYVYLGSASGLAATAAWTAESDQTGADLGKAVASAGDVNGDGFGDVIVGAPDYDNGHPNEGRAYVYLGSASGLATTAAWTVESNQPGANFGRSVTTAGDVNGDGFGDVIVGADGYDNGQTDEGRAFVYFGSASGLATSAAWTAESDQAEAYFGISVASAGDVNGDGFGDVMVGAYKYDSIENDEGWAFVYSVPSAARPHLRLSDPGANRPLAPWNALPGSAVRATALGATPFGRLNVKAEVEVKPLGVAFDGQGTTMSSSWTPGFSGGAFQELVTDVPLVQAKPHHLRWRLRYRPSDGRPAVASRWIYVPLSGDARGVHFRFGVCGNSLLEGDEGCDDGNVLPSDGCNAACKWENGVGCTPNSASSCGSGFCADSVCCDSACAGLCQACSAQLKGSGLDGECGNFAAGTDPEDECIMDPESTCQQDGVCNGNGACRIWAAGTLCGSNACAGNVSKLATCDGFGLCLLDTVGTDCGAYGCNPATGQCLAACITDADCIADAYCDLLTGQCKPKAMIGNACTASAQCQSGHCVDNVCCNEACDGTCQACGQNGICSNVPAGTTDVACAPDPAKPCGFTGQCTDAGACEVAAADTVCEPASCDNGAARTYSCNGLGMCFATTTSCGNYACDAGCKTTCASDADCIAGVHCENGQCKPDSTLGKTCTANDECASGHCVALNDVANPRVCCESDCNMDGNACGNTGYCTLTGQCEVAKLGTPCGKTGCSKDGHRYLSQICVAGACVADPAFDVDCSPYQCADATSCKATCENDNDCAPKYACRNGRCGANTCTETKECLEGEVCSATTKTCVPAGADPQGCTCQTPGSHTSNSRWIAMSLVFVLLVLRRNQSPKALEMDRSVP